MGHSRDERLEKVSAKFETEHVNSIAENTGSDNSHDAAGSNATRVNSEDAVRRVPVHSFPRQPEKNTVVQASLSVTQTPSQREINNEVEDSTPFVSTLTVYPRYRHHPNHSQSSFSPCNGSMPSATHSRMGSREQFSWDSLAWKEVGAELSLPVDPTREQLRLGWLSGENGLGAHDSNDECHRKHVRSLAGWDRNEVDALWEKTDKGAVTPNRTAGYITPIGMKDPNSESLFETAPLGHQHSFSLLSHKDTAQPRGESEGTDSALHTDRETGEQSSRGLIMTHVIVNFKHLYGVFYVPESEWGTFNVGDLVSVESHTGENTGRVVCDLTEVMRNESLIPQILAQLPREVLYPEDPSLPLETVDSVTNKETLLRLPRVIRRGMNKGKKRLYYARRRDTEAFNICQRLVRERGFNLKVSSVEYQVDFKRITVFCSGPSSSASPNELMAFIQQLALQLRGSAVEVLFSTESPGCVEITRSITNGVFNDMYSDIMSKMQDSEGVQTHTHTQAQAQTQTQTQTQMQATSPLPPTKPQSRHPPRVSRPYIDGTMLQMNPPPIMPVFGMPPSLPSQHPVMMAALSVNALYGMTGMPHVSWGMPSPTPPPYIGHTSMASGMTGRM